VSAKKNDPSPEAQFSEDAYAEAMDQFVKEFAKQLHGLYRKLYSDDDGFDSSKMMALAADAFVVFLAAFGDVVVKNNPDAEGIADFDPYTEFMNEFLPLVAARGAGVMLSEDEAEGVTEALAKAMKPPEGKLH